MSELGSLLENQREIQKLSAKEMAARMGIAQSELSQITTDARRGVRPAKLARILGGISDDPSVKAEVLKAAFRDQCTPRYKNWIRIVPEDEAPAPRLVEAPATYGDDISQFATALHELRLPNSIIRALADIARAIPGRQKFRVVIEDLGKFAKDDLLNREETE